MTALTIAGPMRLESRAQRIPEAAPGEVLVRTAFVGICGSDIELLRGTSFYLTEKLNAYPLVFGHEWSGTVVATAPDVQGIASGDRVLGQTILTCGTCSACAAGRRSHCRNRAEMGLFGHAGAAAEYVRVPASSLVAVPQTLSLRDAALVEPSVTVVHALSRVRSGANDRVVVIGTGTLGLVAVQVAASIAERVDVVGVEESGLALALEAGAHNAYRPDEVPHDAYTVAIEASGAASSVALIPHLLEPGGRGALVGVVNTGTPDFIPSFVTLKDLELHGVLHGLDYYDRTVSLYAKGTISPRHLLDRLYPASAAVEAFDALLHRNLVRPKLILEFAGESL
jgi:2-desacetyl-2-hydroxyethyl bacteriochlorophyllide A dehydrogenase